MITLVTALYEMKRPDRTFEDYKTWFKNTLTIPYPMIIYTEEKNKLFIESIRKNLPTKVYYESNVPLYHTKQKVIDIIKNADNKSNIKKLLYNHPNHIEFTCFDYIPIINSKFIWLKRAISENYFNSSSFYWIDAGISRFFHINLSSIQFVLLKRLFI